MIMESFKGFEHKYSYAIVGHAGTHTRAHTAARAHAHTPHNEVQAKRSEWRAHQVGGTFEQATGRRFHSWSSVSRQKTRTRRSRCCAACTPTPNTAPAETRPSRYPNLTHTHTHTTHTTHTHHTHTHTHT
jgi:hypothetical protein